MWWKKILFSETTIKGWTVVFWFSSDSRFFYGSIAFLDNKSLADITLSVLNNNDFITKIKQITPSDKIAYIFCFELESSNTDDFNNLNDSIRVVFRDEVNNFTEVSNYMALPSLFVGLVEIEIDYFRNSSNRNSLIPEIMNSISHVALMKKNHEYSTYEPTRYKLYEVGYCAEKSIFSGNKVFH